MCGGERMINLSCSSEAFLWFSGPSNTTVKENTSESVKQLEDHKTFGPEAFNIISSPVRFESDHFFFDIQYSNPKQNTFFL